MLEKTVNISGTEVRFRSSAAIPRLYRIKFKRDIFKDLSKLEAAYKGKTTGDGEIPIEDLEIRQAGSLLQRQDDRRRRDPD